ncbi:hypothetical protein DICVIV_05953 [Dictyocaulus viviparus]|uniref:Integrase zinc-binding domain-containing protein n=1 Tax=Dictyocaulus viviparus TaxID=29172 RepID=A0A0D8XTI7_DICVI|nr:hypothetical protein DICVIV_05953 [Dictyocaulus viviparus]
MTAMLRVVYDASAHLRNCPSLNESTNTPFRFGHVRTKYNPADCATKGLNKDELRHHIWWNGPPIIHQLDSNISQFFTLPANYDSYDVSTTMATLTSTVDDLLDWSTQSDLKKTQRTVAYVLRFLKKIVSLIRENLRNRILHNIPELQSKPPQQSAIEYENALILIVRNHQKMYCGSHVRQIHSGLRLYTDNRNVIRYKGRLGKADILQEAREPIFISSKTRLAELVVRDAHLPYHCSTCQTMTNVRQRFWMSRLRNLLRKVIKRCVACQKMNNLPYRHPDIEDLPETRVQRTRPFQHRYMQKKHQSLMFEVKDARELQRLPYIILENIID